MMKNSKINMLNWLIDWYKSNCDGDWEHMFGVKIETLDNPGWSVNINVEDTNLEDKCFPELWTDNGDDDWIFCRVENNVFRGSGDPDKLEEMITIFKEWAES